MNGKVRLLVDKLSRPLVGVAAVVLFGFVFGPGVLAQFARMTGNVGFGYGYGYGYGQGGGWDEGQYAGHRTDGTQYNEYSVSSTDFGYLPLDGAAVTVGSSELADDNVSEEFVLPFTFNFYGTDYNSFRASSNGFIYFDASSTDSQCCEGLSLPWASGGYFDESAQGLIAGAWTDLHFYDSNSWIKYETFGTAPNRVTVVEYHGVYEHGDDGAPRVNFQIHLHETSNIIEIHTAGINFGETMDRQVTQGVSRADGRLGVASPGMEAEHFSVSNVAYRFTPNSALGDGNGEEYAYGWGYGRMLPNERGDISYDSSTDTYKVDLHNVPDLAEAGLMVPNGSATEATSVYFMHKVDVVIGQSRVSIDKGTTLALNRASANFQELSGSDIVDTSALSGTGPVVSDLSFGLPSLGLTVTPAMHMHMYVGTNYNGQTLKVHRKGASEAWAQVTTCLISAGYCDFDTSHLSSFAVTATASSGSGHTVPSVTLSYPVSGENFTAGTTQAIRWSTSGRDVSGVRILLSTDGGSTWPVVIADNLVNSGNYNWVVSNLPSTMALIKVEAIGNGSVLASASSAGSFTITAASSQAGGTSSGSSGSSSTGGQTSSNSGDGGNGSQNGTLGGVTFSGAMTREAANAKLPAVIPVDTLVKLPDDHNPATEYDTTVYYIGLDAKRHPFPNRQTFLSWYRDFSKVQPTTLETLASIPLGSPIMVRPGTLWVKIVSDPRTYYVEAGNKLRWIKDEATAVKLGGAGWSANVIEVDPTFFAFFGNGSDLDAASLTSSWPTGGLVKAEGEATTYYVGATGLRALSGETAMAANEFQQRFVRTTPATSGWKSLAVASPITAFEEALFSLMH